METFWYVDCSKCGMYRHGSSGCLCDCHAIAPSEIDILRADLAATRSLLADALAVADGLRRERDEARARLILDVQAECDRHDATVDDLCDALDIEDSEDLHGTMVRKARRLVKLIGIETHRDALAKFVRERFGEHLDDSSVCKTVLFGYTECDCGHDEALKLLAAGEEG